ncbi:hypothetical protein EV186_105159 [Labedaea rhizosphaerae]|uniref:Uncharacterized protein n=1 Tax=Labedaea rhizosphaerae TaxID=598644 RepID=A0A4R6S6V3_LABRH|nr:hypothetical protein EV186_105159 [Labedaea rhizosphaerae]
MRTLVGPSRSRYEVILVSSAPRYRLRGWY